MEVPAAQQLFTTFAPGHFVKPGQFAQPVKPVLTTFAGAYTEVYAAAAIELDYDEPNAVTDAEIELVPVGDGVSRLEISTVSVAA
jgi:hypothetical protein